MNRLETIARLMGDALYAKYNKKSVRDTGLSPEDRDMFDRIFRRIEQEQQHGTEVIYVDHFALKPGWKPNQTGTRHERKVLSSQDKKKLERRASLKSKLPSLMSVRKVE